MAQTASYHDTTLDKPESSEQLNNFFDHEKTEQLQMEQQEEYGVEGDE